MITPLLKIENISLRFPEYEKSIIQDISVNLYAGDRIVILGGNGSGKSSFIRLINRTYMAGSGMEGSGNIEFKYKNLHHWNRKEFAQSVVTLTQDPAQSLFYDLTVLENCILWESRFRFKLFSVKKRAVRKFYEEYLQEYHHRLNDRLDAKVINLSGGEKQALLLALCLFKPPALLLLDEHTSALDPNQASHIMQTTEEVVKRQGITTLMTTHNLDHALTFGNRLLAIKDGKIVFEAGREEKTRLTRQDLLEFCY